MFAQQDLISTIIWFILIFVFIIFGPRLMTTQTIWKLEKDVSELEFLADKSRKIVVKKFVRNPSKAVNDKIRSFMEFFIAEPVSTDPFGIIKKIDHVVRNADARQKMFVDSVAPNLSKTEKEDFRASLIHSSGVHQIAKIVRHYLETIKKYKIYQLAIIIQMQIPFIRKVADALYSSVEAFTESIPIGDGIGAMAAAEFITDGKKIKRLEEDEFVYWKTKISGRSVVFSKADGPGTSIGHPGKFVEKIVKREKINRIITVDAASGLEGERTGSVAEGVGFGMRGGNPVDSFEIEEIALKYKLFLDDVAIKEISEEALLPMKKQILGSLPRVVESVKSAIERAGKKDNILVIGLGNTCGIGNDRKSVDATREKLKKYYRKQAESNGKKSKWF